MCNLIYIEDHNLKTKKTNKGWSEIGHIRSESQHVVHKSEKQLFTELKGLSRKLLPQATEYEENMQSACVYLQ